ncbi:unnamed protein product [Symbiodinium microadriaticum]|nr:unnamed protein product [Symbiodinium microadriaticum]
MKRREFVIKTSALGAASSFYLASGKTFAFSPNETVNIAVVGLGGRSYALMEAISRASNIQLTHACEVDGNRRDEFLSQAKEKYDWKVKGVIDFQEILDNKDIDAVAIATPEHWHAPMAIMAMKAGKHVYVEKPCSHNLQENEWLVTTARNTGLQCQMGNQQRSSITTQKAIQDIRDGVIGDVYYAKAWYSNTRGSIGVGKKVAVPDYLNWDLWQGPAPREDYRDNVHPYNWHWFRTWGTGELHNNGTHEIDVCRWALGVGLPSRVVSTGGRLHFKDDWEYYDTQLASFEFEGGKTILWEGRSCNGINQYGRGRGAIVHGTEGTFLLDRGGSIQYDLKGKEIKNEREPLPGTSTSTTDTSGFDGLTVRHMQNLVNGIREGDVLQAPIADASKSTHICHLGNIAQDLQVSLDVDPKSGKIEGNEAAMKKWGRTYKEGWKKKIMPS